jgi:ATP-binding cassette subfamily F protein uup
VSRKRRLTYKEKNELDSLPRDIDEHEKRREQIYTSLSDPVFLRDGTAVIEAKARLDAIETELAELLRRWEELETIAQAG